MKNFYVFLPVFLLISILSLPTTTNAQNTWDYVYSILETKCDGASCHDAGSSAPGFELTSKADVYNSLINSTPTNVYASTHKMKTVAPGYPERSFLLRKVSHGLGAYQSSDITMVADEGQQMPAGGQNALSPVEVEIIRQWVLAGADDNTAYATADTSLISYYYNIGGRTPIQAPTPPAPGEGIQIHLGPIFLAPNSEHEYFLKHDLFLENDIEVTGLDLVMNDESHHFILRKFLPGTKASWDDGISLLNPLTAFDSDKDYVMAWQNDERFDLPEGTAYYWDTATALDLNYHLINPYNEILPFELYLNISTQPQGTAEKEMKSSLINNAALLIPNDGSMHEFTESAGFDNKSIWTLASHTHERGVGYDIYLAGVNGNPDSLIYNGNVNYATGVNAGYYDWEHPPTRIFEPFSEAFFDTATDGTKKYSGFKHKARYVNNTPNNIIFGFTSEGEMMIFYVQYVDGVYKVPEDTSIVNPVDTTGNPVDTTGNPIGIASIDLVDGSYTVYPNPVEASSQILFELNKSSIVSIVVTDVLGREVKGIINNESLTAGNHSYTLDANKLGESGVYFVRLTVDGESITRRIIKTN